jgi:hypothetical protein
MKIYIDESGDFNVEKSEYVSVIAGVIIPENKAYKLDALFNKLKRKVSLKEKDDNGEIKGSLLNPHNLKFVFEFLAKNLDFQIALVIFDHKSTTAKHILEHRMGQAERFQKGKDYYLTGPVKAKAVLDFFDEKKRWVERRDLISDVLYIQLALQVQIIEQALKKIFVHYYDDCYRRLCFEKFTFIIDRKNKKIKKPEKYISELIYGFLETQWSSKEPYIMIDKLGKNEHPMTKFDVNKDGKIGTDLKKLFGEGLKFEDSKNHKGLQLADIIASGVRRIVLGEIDRNIFNLIRKNSAFFERKWRAVTLATFCLKGNKCPKERTELYKFLEKSPEENPV